MAGIPPDIDTQEAVLAAQVQLARIGNPSAITPGEIREIRNDDLILAYIFNLDPRGYIVVGASTVLPTVIAYSFESNFGIIEEENPLLTLLRADLSGRWASAQIPGNSYGDHYRFIWKALLKDGPNGLTGPVFEQWPATGNGWLKTNWTQEAPYNAFCPMDPVTAVRSYAGCPATAMAQIMNFHETTNNTHFDDADDYYHNYAGRQYWIDDDHEAIDFPGFPDLNIYLDTLNDHYLSGLALTTEDKAALTFACGTAARQVYTSQGSGTFGVNQAYEAYQRFGCSTVALLDSDDADLFERLKQNIIDTLPAHLAVVDESWSTGHNVVVDGYNTDDYYHLNFGWGGAYNGWYLLPDEIPYDLTVIEGVVMDIMMKLPTWIKESAVSGRQSAVSIMPNPASTAITIELRGISSKFPISIFDFQGREILKHPITEQQKVVDVSTFTAGIYFVRVISDDGVMVGKFVKE